MRFWSWNSRIFFGPGPLVVLEDLDHVLAVVVLPHVEQGLAVLRRPAGLDHVAVGLALDVGDGVVEGGEVLLGDDGDARGLELVLAEGPVVLEAVGVGAASHHLLALLAQGLGLGALAQHVVEDDDVGPVDVGLPVVDLGHEAVADLPLALALDEVADLVVLLDRLPGDVADEAVDGHEEELHGALEENICRRASAPRRRTAASTPTMAKSTPRSR